jgi:DNA-3-methyladenine glycosylase II
LHAPSNVTISSPQQQASFSRSLVLHPRAPFRLDLTVWALRRRKLNDVDGWEGSTYRRVLLLDDVPVDVAVTQQDAAEAPALQVTLNNVGNRTNVEAEAHVALAKMLSLGLDIDPFYSLAATDPMLAPLAARFRGLRPPRFASVFECLVNAVALQQLSLEAGLTLLNRLSRTFGARSSAAENHAHAFPEPAELAHVQPGAVRALGFSVRKATTIVAIADAALQGRLDLESLAAREDGQVVETLTQIPPDRPLERRVHPAARTRPAARLSRRRRGRAQEPCALARARGAARLRRRATRGCGLASLRRAHLLPLAARPPRRARRPRIGPRVRRGYATRVPQR